jgi:FixJ family two-component response regulator
MKSADPLVFVVDDDPGVRDALASLIASAGFEVECFAAAAEFLGRRPTDNPACLVLDVRMPGLSGLELQQQLARRERPIPIIFISAHGDIPMVVHAMKEGAVEFLPKPFHDEQLLQAIHDALAGEVTALAERAEIARLKARYARLTPRQCQILALIVEGKLNKQIAAQLGLSENTVKVHRHRIMEKMSADGVAELTLMMARLG